MMQLGGVSNMTLGVCKWLYKMAYVALRSMEKYGYPEKSLSGFEQSDAWQKVFQSTFNLCAEFHSENRQVLVMACHPFMIGLPTHLFLTILAVIRPTKRSTAKVVTSSMQNMEKAVSLVALCVYGVHTACVTAFIAYLRLRDIMMYSLPSIRGGKPALASLFTISPAPSSHIAWHTNQNSSARLCL